ncbi:hypothetical protein SL103_18395 [Streptomyces lydicus]|uniref:Uncharacterized protein n=1 Tax=Streptomyces lydicus TaxID=47763 RepID=A0A1D7VMG6_9ACTN|nr:hypothetical protein SL103_18395 [Streptomyces lydicus]
MRARALQLCVDRITHPYESKDAAGVADRLANAEQGVEARRVARGDGREIHQQMTVARLRPALPHLIDTWAAQRSPVAWEVTATGEDSAASLRSMVA